MRMAAAVLLLFLTFTLGACTKDERAAEASRAAATTTTAAESSTLSSTTTTIATASAPVVAYELARTPDGYRPGVVTSSAADRFIIVYAPTQSSAPEGDRNRISVEVVPPDEMPWAGYATLEELNLRDGTKATFFVVSGRADDSSARRGLSWQAGDNSQVTIYGPPRSSSAELAALAVDVRERTD